jgi:hypothetical protein
MTPATLKALVNIAHIPKVNLCGGLQFERPCLSMQNGPGEAGWGPNLRRGHLEERR